MTLYQNTMGNVENTEKCLLKLKYLGNGNTKFLSGNNLGWGGGGGGAKRIFI